MEGAVRVALRKRGDDPRDHALVAFGGAGPLHAAELARRLSIATVIVPPHPGTLSALGLLTADVRLDFAASELHRSDEESLRAALVSVFAALTDRAQARSTPTARSEPGRTRSPTPATSATSAKRTRSRCRSISIASPLATPTASSTTSTHMHGRAYGFASPADDARSSRCASSSTVAIDKPSLEERARGEQRRSAAPTLRSVYMPGSGWADAAIHDRSSLERGARFDGPAIVHQADSTTLVPPSVSLVVDEHATSC